MSDQKPQPPRLALWFLQKACPGHNEALTGDLLERWHEGQTRSWFRRQVLFAFVIGLAGEVRRYGPHLCYALAGTAIPILFGQAASSVPEFLHWYALPWPWSMLVFELSRPALLTWAALPVLAVGLVMQGAFRWSSLLRTGIIRLVLLGLGRYALDALPWLLRPVAGQPYRIIATAQPYHKVPIILPVLQLLLFFSAFFISAWLGCRSPRLTASWKLSTK